MRLRAANTGEYSYAFSVELQQSWNWSHRYAGQHEIQSSADHVADSCDLRRHTALGTRVQSASFDEASGLQGSRLEGRIADSLQDMGADGLATIMR